MKIKGMWQSASVQMQIMYLLMIILLSSVVFSMLGFAGALFYGMPNMSDLSDGNTLPVLKWMQGCTAVGIFVAPPLLFAYLTQHNLGWKKVSRQASMLSVAIILLSVPSIQALALWNEGLHLPAFLSEVELWMRTAEAEAMRMTEAFLQMDSTTALVANLLVMALIPAVGEELLFRGVLQKLFYQWNGRLHLSVWLTAFLFSAMHFQFLGFVPRLLLGALLGYLFVWSGSVWLPIIAHFANNAAAVLLAYFVGQGTLSDPASSFDSGVLLVSALGCLLMIYFLKELSGGEAIPNET